MSDQQERGRVFLDSIGCRLNQSEIERMARQFRGTGYRLVADPERSDLIVLNTCTVTSGADSESRRRLRRYHEAQPQAKIVATGCWSSLQPEAAREFDGVDQVVANEDKDDLVPLVLGEPAADFEREPVERKPVPGLRMRTRAFIKVQDGCDHHCTYCLTTVARGASRSLALAQVVEQVNAAVAGGAKEAVLSGVQLSGYGRDLEPQLTLTDLVRSILHHSSIARLRLSSLEPWGLPEDFFELWQDARLCRQLHLPLQSGCETTLRRMGRPITASEYAELVERGRRAIPGLALTTDVICGFPGETESEFERSLAFIERMRFADGHVFPFSPRPGTAAVRLPARVHSWLAKRRAKRARKAVARSARAFRSHFVGRELTVLWESATALDERGWHMSGLSDNYLRVQAHAERDLWNHLTRVRIEDCDDDTLLGTALATSGPGREHEH